MAITFIKEPNRPPTDNLYPRLRAGEFANAKYTQLAAGPPCLEVNDDTIDLQVELRVVGLGQNFSLGVQAPISVIPEIGSIRFYFIRERAMWGMTMGRVLIDQHNLAKALYAYYLVYDYDKQKITDEIDVTKLPGQIEPVIPPNSGGIFMNLDSSLFDNPVGLHVDFMNSVEDARGNIGNSFSQWYIENVYIQGINLGISAGSSVIMEGVNFRVDRAVPIELSALEIPEASCVLGAESLG